MRLVDDRQEVVWEVVKKATRCTPLLTSIDVARIVLNSRAEANLFDHFEVEGGSHLQSLRLKELAFFLKLQGSLGHLVFDVFDCLGHALDRGNVVRSWEDRNHVLLGNNVSSQRVQ